MRPQKVRHPFRVLAGLAVVGLTAVGLPSQAATATQVLRGTTVITADRSGSADFVLNQDAVLRLEKDYSTRDIAMVGKGRIVGFSLTLNGPGSNYSSDTLSALRVLRAGKPVTYTGASGTTYPRPTACSTTGSLPASVPGVYEGCGPDPAPKFVVVHQGRYHLRVLTDGAPLTITLTLRGIPGSARLRPTKALASQVSTLRQIDDVAGRYRRFETLIKPTRRSEATINLDARFSSAPIAAGVNGCVYEPDTQPLVTDYAPNCPRGRRGGFFGPLLNPTRADYDADSLFAVGQTELEAGTQRLGFSAHDEDGLTVRSATVAVLEQE